MKLPTPLFSVFRTVALLSVLSLTACVDEPGSANNQTTGVSIDPSVNSTLAPVANQRSPNQIFSDTHFRCTDHSMRWDQIQDWYYQLQNVDYATLADSRYDLLVIDSEPVNPTDRPNRNTIERLKCEGPTDRLVVSYLSIGQAEDYRYYYQDDWEVGNPDWIVYSDLYWPGDYYVRYWDPRWQNILYGAPDSRVDRIIEAGFDGVYLDVIDAYYLFEDDYPNAIQDMYTLVKNIADYARAQSGNPDFGVFVQNSEELIHPDIFGPEWATHLTGIGKEEPFFWATDERVEDDMRYWNDLYLGLWVSAGKLVINVDYVTTPEHAEEVFRLSREKGYIPLIQPDKNLSRVTVIPGFGPQ